MPLRKLEPSFRERPWGTENLEPWFLNPAGKRIGEVWFQASEIPLLVKFLFANEDLSVQVHPDDAYAQTHHGSPGKTEMWHVLAAQSGARIAAGFREPVSRDQMRAAALDGTIGDLIEWFEAKAGDTFFIASRTVHAIGAGLTICEIQQPSDITYRIYDYQRGRELHLEHALAVSRLVPHAARSADKVACEYFSTERFDVSSKATLPSVPGDTFLIVIEGEGEIGGEKIRAGEVWHASGSEPLRITGSLRLLRTGVTQAPPRS
ncbi:MAG: type I phosphomannose isomerase catalytic subunit [Bdellovibrionota bacterium]